jgi:CheY-like chemotaxis protein
MTEFGDDVSIPGVRFVSIPVQSLSIANVLNGKADSKAYTNSSDIIRFTFPRARLLVVDDIATNLKVAEGLLAPYSATVDTCLSGSQAIDMVKHAASQKRNYDIVFMDHMMTEMDGIEATAIIRAWEKECAEKNGYCEPSVRRKQIPIIALTANAVVGMREMFLENGFNDFLDKPIDVGKLDEILGRWISKEKREESNEQLATRKDKLPDNDINCSAHSSLSIPGVDMAKGTAMSGGTLGAYSDVLAFFRKDAQERLPLLQTVPNADALPAFVTQVHALKSASASIGAGELSAQAAALETAGKAGNIAFIQENLGVFAKCLSELAEGILIWEKTAKEHNSEEQAGGSVGDLNNAKITPLLHELAQALKSQKGDVIDRILEQITQQPLDTGVKTAIGQIADEVLMAEYEKALGIIDSLLQGEDSR